MSNNPRPTQSTKKVFDVMRPGRAPASPTSRPVIIGHQPQTPDDQFVGRPQGTRLARDPSEERPLLSGHKQPDLLVASEEDVPSTESALADVALSEVEQPAAASSDTAVLATPPAVEPGAPETELTPRGEGALSEADKDADQPARSDQSSAAAPLLSAQPNSDTPAPTLSVDESEGPSVPAAPKEDMFAETGVPILEHAVVSHHNRHRARLWEWMLIFLFMLALAAIALNFLLDAEVISTELSVPHTNLIR